MKYSICLEYKTEDCGSRIPFRLLVKIETSILINFYFDLSFGLQIIWRNNTKDNYISYNSFL